MKEKPSKKKQQESYPSLGQALPLHFSFGGIYVILNGMVQRAKVELKQNRCPVSLRSIVFNAK